MEIYEKILTPLQIEHVTIIASERTQNFNKFVMKYIDGLTCGDSPDKQHLYKAATSIGNFHRISRENLGNVERDKMLQHLDAISGVFNITELIPFVEELYNKYETYPLSLNHYDMHFKNLIHGWGNRAGELYATQ